MSVVKEPAKEETVWKLGMTKGALIAFGIMVVAIAIGFAKIYQVSNDAHDAAKTAQFAADQAKILAKKNSLLVKQGQQSKVALCAQQQSLRKSVRLGVQFLVDVDTGKRELPAGFTKADILIQVKRNQDLLKSFDGLKCPS